MKNNEGEDDREIVEILIEQEEWGAKHMHIEKDKFFFDIKVDDGQSTSDSSFQCKLDIHYEKLWMNNGINSVKKINFNFFSDLSFDDFPTVIDFDISEFTKKAKNDSLTIELNDL